MDPVDKRDQVRAVWCTVAAHNQSLHAGFEAVYHKIKTGGSAGGDGIRVCRGTRGTIMGLATR
jgi:hypothetical protein